MNRYISAKAICPCYRDERRQIVRCGNDGEATVHRVFQNASEAKKHKQRFCQKDYRKCPVFKLHEMMKEPSE